MTLTQQTSTESGSGVLRSIAEALCTNEAGATGAETAGALAKIAVFSTFFPLGLRVIQWLQDGIWPALTLDTLGFTPPWIPWAGVQQALHALYRLPLECVSVAFCGTVYAVAAVMLDRRRTAKRQRPHTI